MGHHTKPIGQTNASQQGGLFDLGPMSTDATVDVDAAAQGQQIVDSAKLHNASSLLLLDTRDLATLFDSDPAEA